MIDEDELHIAFCWYQPEQWQELKEVVPDPEAMNATYAEWKKDANKAFNSFTAKGLNIKKVSINTKKLVAWCSEKGLEPISSSRSEYAAFILESRDK